MAGTLRPLPGQDPRAWTRAVFAAGDHAGAAMFGDAGAMEHHAARALLLGDAKSFAALADFGGAEARFHAAAARFVHGDTARARRELQGLDLPQAQNLARLLARDRIRVLTQLPWLPGAMTDLQSGIRSDALFDVRNISHRSGDLQNRPYAGVASLLDDGFAPDFFVATMAEWHHLPPDLLALPCPRFGHVADHDLHIQTIRPWLDLFDELCVTDRTEWLDVQGLTRGAVTSFPHVFGMPARLPSAGTGERHLDFFVSGTMLDPYHPDKAMVLHELLAMPDIALRVVKGFMGPLAFYALLAASKASFTFVRRPGAMPTRGLESLALGCAVALQEESILNLWVGENEGAVTYGPQRGDLAAAVRRIVDGWQHFGPAAARGAALVREQFAMPRVASRYFRYLALRAAVPRPGRTPIDTSSWCQKRLCVSRTWLPDDPMVRRRTMQANFRRLGETVAARPAARPIVDMARELLCEFAYYHGKGEAGQVERSLHDDALRLLEKCGRLFPDDLAARFLHVRTLWHYGDANARMAALQLAADIVDADPARWQIGPDDDVMPFDYHAECFNYRDYLDLVAAAAKGRRVPAVTYARLVLAAIAGYVARKTDTPEWHERVVALDPGFARYRLDLARCLLRRGDAIQRQRGRELLHELADGSSEFADAARELQCSGGGLTEASARALRRLEEDTIDAGIGVAALFGVERREARVAAATTVTKSDAPAARLAVLVPATTTGRELADLLADLDLQTKATSLEVVLGIAPDAVGVEQSVPESWRGRCRLVQLPAAAPFAARLSACARAATAPVLTTALPGDRFRPDAFEILLEELDQHGDCGLAFANEGWTDGAVARFAPSTCVGFLCLPPFAQRRLARTNGIGRHAVWRRSLHDRHGWFDSAFGAAAEYEFWLRVMAHTRARQSPLLLSSSCLRSPWRARREAAVDAAAVARARELHAPSERRPFVAQRVLPPSLLAPGIREEAESHGRLGVIEDADRRALGSFEQFLGTSLLHGDVATAICLLRAAVADAPQMVSPHLALADLLEATGRSSHEVLQAARRCDPCGRMLERRLVAAGPATAAPASSTPLARPEPTPCPA